ncbi:Pyridoxamine 5'-phosphate oxidase [Vulgatibacter incomptus]|uniref:Pyridoxamine 5'-phosphate oxidase n=1 Tax=Vulgatibacter incomptus TaxID=1391653 RepID=A0A0K1PAQ5_9BACT|nr:Pyridoxamine 5'-phosphate oxidase [Vulgatibacter incomptus]
MKEKEAPSGGMTVREAGRKGGLIGGRKGGQTVLRERGPKFYSEIGKKGGQRVRELIERAKELEARAEGAVRKAAKERKPAARKTTTSRRTGGR